MTKLRNSDKNKLALAKALMGSVPGKTDLDADKAERIGKSNKVNSSSYTK